MATALSVHALATSRIDEFGTDEQREAWHPEMATGRPVGAFALSEPEAGSNPTEMTTEARLEGDEYVINGKKQWKDKLGLRASDTTSLIFDDVRIPAENRLIGRRGVESRLLDSHWRAIAIAAQAVGVAQAALDDAVSYANEREQFGKPIIDHQAIGHKLAEMATTARVHG